MLLDYVSQHRQTHGRRYDLSAITYEHVGRPAHEHRIGIKLSRAPEIENTHIESLEALIDQSLEV